MQQAGLAQTTHRPSVICRAAPAARCGRGCCREGLRLLALAQRAQRHASTARKARAGHGQPAGAAGCAPRGCSTLAAVACRWRGQAWQVAHAVVGQAQAGTGGGAGVGRCAAGCGAGGVRVGAAAEAVAGGSCRAAGRGGGRTCGGAAVAGDRAVVAPVSTGLQRWPYAMLAGLLRAQVVLVWLRARHVCLCACSVDSSSYCPAGAMHGSCWRDTRWGKQAAMLAPEGLPVALQGPEDATRSCAHAAKHLLGSVSPVVVHTGARAWAEQAEHASEGSRQETAASSVAGGGARAGLGAGDEESLGGGGLDDGGFFDSGGLLPGLELQLPACPTAAPWQMAWQWLMYVAPFSPHTGLK